MLLLHRSGHVGWSKKLFFQLLILFLTIGVVVEHSHSSLVLLSYLTLRFLRRKSIVASQGMLWLISIPLRWLWRLFIKILLGSVVTPDLLLARERRLMGIVLSLHHVVSESSE